MKIYFACSITGGRDDEAVYRQLVDAMLADGHHVPTADLADSIILEMETLHSPQDVYSRDVAWLEESDCVVAEVSTPSHGVGYEVAYGLHLGKPVLCLYQQGIKVSKMLTGNYQPTLQIQAYEDTQQALKLLAAFLSSISPN